MKYVTEKYLPFVRKYLPLVYLALGLVNVGVWFLAFIQNTTWQADFTAFYTGGSMITTGMARDLYDLNLQAQHQQTILGNHTFGGGFLAFYYPPYVALLFAPLSAFSLKTAYLIWSIYQFVLLTLLFLALTAQAKKYGWSKQAQLYLLTGITAISAFRSALLLGTVTFIMLAVLLGLLYALVEKRDWLAAALIVIGSLKPQVILLPALMVFILRRWRVMGYTILIFTGVLLVTTLIFGPQIWLDMNSVLTQAYSQGGPIGVDPAMMDNFRGVLARLFGDSAWVDRASLLLFGLSGVAVLYYGIRYVADTQYSGLLFGFAVLLGTLFGLHVNPQDGMYVVVPVVCLYAVPDISRRKWVGMGLAASPLLALLYQTVIPQWFYVQFPVLFMFWLLWIMIREFAGNGTGTRLHEIPYDVTTLTEVRAASEYNDYSNGETAPPQLPDTFEILYRLLFDDLNNTDCSNWAAGLLLEGHDIPSVNELLLAVDMSPVELKNLVYTVLIDLSVLQDREQLHLCEVLEAYAIRAYLNDCINVYELTKIGVRIFDVCSDFNRYLFWEFLGITFSSFNNSGDDPMLRVDPSDIDGSVKRLLKKEGKISVDLK